MTRRDLSQVHKDGSTYANQAMSYTTLTKEKPKTTMLYSLKESKGVTAGWIYCEFIIEMATNNYQLHYKSISAFDSSY